MAWTTIPASAVDADSPMDVVLFGYIKDDLDYLKARTTTGSGHTHNQGGTDEGGPVVPADGSVTNAKLNGGIVPIEVPLVSTTTYTAFVTVHTFYIYFPAGCTSLKFEARLRTDSSSITAFARLKFVSDYSNEVSNTSTGFLQVSMTLTPSAGYKEQIQAVEVQLKSGGSGVSAILHKHIEATDDSTKDWAVASYFIN